MIKAKSPARRSLPDEALYFQYMKKAARRTLFQSAADRIF